MNVRNIRGLLTQQASQRKDTSFLAASLPYPATGDTYLNFLSPANARSKRCMPHLDTPEHLAIPSHIQTKTTGSSSLGLSLQCVAECHCLDQAIVMTSGQVEPPLLLRLPRLRHPTPLAYQKWS